MTGFENSWSSNMLNFYLNGYEELNYYYMLDHIESFIGLISNDELISNNIKYDIKITIKIIILVLLFTPDTQYSLVG